MQASIPRWQAWIGGIAQQGKFVDTQQMEYTGKSIRKGNVTDKPFAEIKEIVVGYVIVKAESLEEAAAMADGCPILDLPEGSVEVRPLIKFQI
ncbi:MAG: hypothetical protein HC880_07720 [Bacteroidia bacterium]|nr:hypothetical protein [Bacteroidia bacterium]